MPLHAEEWLKTATKMTGNKDQASKILFQKARIHRLYSAMTKDFRVGVDFGERGKGVYATKDSKTGEELLTDLPIVMAKVLQRKTDGVPVCDNCAASLMTARHYFGDALDTMEDD